MPENRVMYLGIVLIVAAVSLWLGAELTKRIEWTVPYVGGAGVVLVVLAWRSNSRRRGSPSTPPRVTHTMKLAIFDMHTYDREAWPRQTLATRTT